MVIPYPGAGSHALRTRAPLTVRKPPVRLACVKHAASVRSEPESNSQVLEQSTQAPGKTRTPAQTDPQGAVPAHTHGVYETYETACFDPVPRRLKTAETTEPPPTCPFIISTMRKNKPPHRQPCHPPNDGQPQRRCNGEQQPHAVRRRRQGGI